MGKKLLPGHLILGISFCLAAQVHGATVSRNAERYFNRGMAAVELAQTPEGYEAAIQQFEKARAIAPSWPDVHYNLGLVQDKVGKYRDAVASFRKYLRLAPTSPDAATVRAMAEKLEYKAKQELSKDEVLNIFGSLCDQTRWKRKNLAERIWGNSCLFSNFVDVRRDGAQLVVTYHTRDRRDPGLRRTMRVTPDGKKLNFKTHRYMTDTLEYYQQALFNLEIVSRNSVKMTRNISNPGKPGNDESFVFQRK